MTQSAVEKLQPSRLSDQTELLGDVLDLEVLDLIVKGHPPLPIREKLTGGDVDRTIQGASTVTLPINDNDDAVLTSDLLSRDCDVEIDGLWFRLTTVDMIDRDKTLTFEDREVALLRSYPRPGAPHNGFKVWDAAKFSRAEVARELVREVKELDIRFICPALTGDKAITNAQDAPSQTQRAHARSAGFGPGAQVTVKGHPASEEQKQNIDRVLQTGVSLKARRKVLVCAVMTITQESTATNLKGGDRDSVGLFQQRPSWGTTEQRRLPEYAAAQFFEAAISDDVTHPDIPYGELCQDVQLSAFPDRYEQWHAEADATVTAWGIAGADTAAASGVTLPAGTGAHNFTRGTKQTVNGKRVYTREDNWDMLVRIATEVGWRCFAVSGTVYFIADADLLASQPRMTINRATPGIDKISGSFSQNRKPKKSAFVIRPAYSRVTIDCRIGRWAAPPGTVIELTDLGLFNGRWIVSDVQRPLFNNGATITLVKPQATLPEALSPELRDTTGVSIFTQGSGAAPTGGVDGAAIVAAAQKALELRADYRYLQIRPMPDGLFSKPFPKRIDCSTFATLCYKAAGAPDPNGLGYNGDGYTGTLWRNGTATTTPLPGDLAFYGQDPRDRTVPGHVAVFVGDGRVISMGGPGDPIEVPVAYRTDFVGFKTYIGTNNTPADRHHHR